MPDPVVILDHDRALRFDYDAIDRINALPAGRRGNRNPMQLWGDANGMDFGAFAILIWAGHKHEDSSAEWTIDKAHKEIRRALKLRRTTFRALNEALNDALSKSETIGLGQPRPGDEDDLDEAPAGNRTSPATTDGAPATAIAGTPPIGLPSASAD